MASKIRAPARISIFQCDLLIVNQLQSFKKLGDRRVN